MSGSAAGGSVLVVEDNPQTRKLLRLTLESRGCDVLEAQDATSALALLDREPQLIVQDLLLPDMDGLDLRERMREHPATATTPVIAVSGFAQRLFSPAADHAGFAARLQKPVEPSRLLSAVSSYLAPPDGAAKTVGRRVLVADDTDIQRKLTMLRLRDAGYEVLQAVDGQAALELAHRERPDVVLTDVLMPGLDGYELCAAIRADPELADTPVVLTSSVFVERDDRDLAERVGANGFVTREPDLASVIRAIEQALGGKTHAGQVAAEVTELRVDRLARALRDRDGAANDLEARLAEREAQLAVLEGISDVLSRPGDPTFAIEEILARVLEGTGAGGVEVRGPGTLASIASLGAPPVVGGANIAAALASTAPFLIDRAVLVGIHHGDEVRGLIIIGNRDTALTASQSRLCAAVAQELARAMALSCARAELLNTRDATVERLARVVALRDGETAGHTQRMSNLCALIARRLGLPEEDVELLRIASAMHDIGKVATPDDILLKPGKLTDDEFAVIKEHARIGHGILAGSGSRLLDLAAEIALNHHERWDGSGYPRRVAGDDIPVEARIAAVADVYDALTSDRPYRPAMTTSEAVEILKVGRGRHFDPAVLDAFLSILDEA